MTLVHVIISILFKVNYIKYDMNVNTSCVTILLLRLSVCPSRKPSCEQYITRYNDPPLKEHICVGV